MSGTQGQTKDNTRELAGPQEFAEHTGTYSDKSFNYKENPYMKNGYCASHFCADELDSKDRIMKQFLHGAGKDLTVPIEKQQLLVKAQGWWADVVNCEQNSSNNLYCKPKNKWIWPY